MWFIAFWIGVVLAITSKAIDNIKAEGLTWINFILLIGLVIEVIFIFKFDKWWNAVCEILRD